MKRREVLGALGAIGAAAALPGCATRGAQPSEKRVIDTHHHFYAPQYQSAWLDWEKKRNIPHFQSQVNWSVPKAIEDMDKAGVRTGILSLASTPGIWFDLPAPEVAKRLDCATTMERRWCATIPAASASSQR